MDHMNVGWEKESADVVVRSGLQGALSKATL